ncbi:hypothetical protein [Humisphaera borealis]|uniref:Uncharacterized protein n=1 Tax=Humisphaera borealis TaxID=2807512 RepID=A0A7M2WU76_9BACT|nr:hypothetical protein [Humisphaera borealis]QOV88090.1 hypothetical protein IPV69_17725 [Humisphaera borealis]
MQPVLPSADIGWPKIVMGAIAGLVLAALAVGPRLVRQSASDTLDESNHGA